MNIPTYAKCFMCKEWIEDKQDWNKGTCVYAEANAKEGMVQAGIAALSIHIEVAWNATPCSEWEASQEGQREIDDYEADQDETMGKARPAPMQYDWERALKLEAGRL